MLCKGVIHHMTLRHASTPEERSLGLMGIRSLGENEGMTFNYPKPQRIGIWMYKCYIDLSVAFLDENKVIREIHDLKAYPTISDPHFFEQKSVTSSFDATYVLEMNVGWFAKRGIKPGDKARWSLISPQGYIESGLSGRVD